MAQNAEEIVRRSVERDWTDFESRKDYTYQEHFEQRELTRDGHVGSQHSETKEIFILGTRPYEKLLARNDKPLSASEARREQEKLDHAFAERQNMSPAERARIERERTQDRKFVREVPDAFVFHLEGMEDVSGQPAWVIDAEPKPGYQPSQALARVFKKVHVKAWIEQNTYHWVKADLEALEPISFDLGLVRIAPGGTLHFEQTRVNDEIWLPSYTLIRGDARLGYVKKMRAEIDIHYSNYRKFRADSQIVSTLAQ